jgi:hypothetical protein
MRGARCPRSLYCPGFGAGQDHGVVHVSVFWGNGGARQSLPQVRLGQPRASVTTSAFYLAMAGRILVGGVIGSALKTNTRS